jgi:hypothetical protein
MTEPTTRILPESGGAPHRLGRHVFHDPKSLRYAAPVLPRSAIVSKRWTRRAAIMDQADTGACTGNAAASWVGTDNAARMGFTAVSAGPVDETFARDLYHRATLLDGFDGTWPPDDTGSDGTSACKALQQVGLCGTYTHAFSLQALESALQTGPALIGISWYNSMFTPDTDGRIVVDTGSGLAGGHELLADELDVEAGRVWAANSWGSSWGFAGRGWFRLAELGDLLADDGDVTIPAVPAPVVPPGPRPFPWSSPLAWPGWLWRALHGQG